MYVRFQQETCFIHIPIQFVLRAPSDYIAVLVSLVSIVISIPWCSVCLYRSILGPISNRIKPETKGLEIFYPNNQSILPFCWYHILWIRVAVFCAPLLHPAYYIKYRLCFHTKLVEFLIYLKRVNYGFPLHAKITQYLRECLDQACIYPVAVVII